MLHKERREMWEESSIGLKDSLVWYLLGAKDKKRLCGLKNALLFRMSGKTVNEGE